MTKRVRTISLILGSVAFVIIAYIAGLNNGLNHSVTKEKCIEIASRFVGISEGQNFQTLKDYQRVSCPLDAKQIAFFGQSNTTNMVDRKNIISIPDNLFQYDYKSGACFKYKEPLLGVDQQGGNSITPLAVRLAKETKQNVIIIPFGHSGSSIIDWAYGYLSHLHTYAMGRLKEAGLKPDVFLWTQGERDAHPNWLSNDKELEIKYSLLGYFGTFDPNDFVFGLSNDVYETALALVMKKTLEFYPEAYFGIALASRCAGVGPDNGIRKAQQSVADSSEKSFISADSDTVFGNGLRYDNCHFSTLGAIEISKQYYESISRNLKWRPNSSE